MYYNRIHMLLFHIIQLLKVGEDTAIIAIKPTKKEFEFVETNLNKLKKEE